MHPRRELTNDRISYLIANAIKGQLNDEEIHELDKWKKESPLNKALFDEISVESSSVIAGWQVEESRRGYEKLQRRLKTKARKRKFFFAWSSAAAIFILAFALWLLLPQLSSKNTEDRLLAAKSIVAAKYGAVLSSNGIAIDLGRNQSGLVVSDQGLHYGDGTELSQTNKLPLSGKDLTASTAKGFTYKLTLPDGTIVWLNANSSLQFPSTFKHGTNREVKLEGEAYFQVRHIASQPFIVHTPRSITKDIGTSFNVKDYPNDGAATSTLEEGSTFVSASNRGNSETDNNGVLLKPGQQATVSQAKLKVAAVDLEENLSWKNGYFRFNNEKLPEVMKNLSRWYDIDVEFEGKISGEGLYGTISRDKTLYEVLRMLEDTKELKFMVKGRRVVVKSEK